MDLDEALLNQVAQGIVNMAQAHAQDSGQCALGRRRIRLHQREGTVVNVVLYLLCSCHAASLIPCPTLPPSRVGGSGTDFSIFATLGREHSSILNMTISPYSECVQWGG